MGFLREITEEYLGALQYVKEVPRDVKLPISRDIVALVGPRRAGKTFLMLKSVKNLLDSGKQALYISLDELQIRRIDVRKLAEMAREEYPRGEIHLFLDEVQEWENWDSKLRWLHDVKDFFLYVTGSSSALQSSEIPSRLRGRYTSVLLLPFSFREVSFREKIDTVTFRERGAIKALLNDYMTWGGFPEVWSYRSREKLVSLLETMFYRDVMERHRIRETAVFLELARLVISSYSCPVTWHSLRKAMRAAGVNVDVKTVMSYVEYMRQANLLFSVKRFTYSEREAMASPKKIYLVDPGIATLLEKPMDRGRRAENLVFLELVRRGYEPCYYVTKTGKEVDFVTMRERIVVEVALEDWEKHMGKLAEAARELGVDEATIVTWDAEGEERAGNCRIFLVPLWKWLLQEAKK
ncbi:ATP-binding protein [Candidatus Methanodesulfokora washburnensis]|uniref:ATP-binding protein n=1 Tax=Candidatus Methanodesulfokora washburnensis TaxID=2478471 RepID=A0A429GSY5_9CREN|nr:ATP-binding protein [Candidatus Methanodesulfokores washburnensis]RSN76915.1 ATP-binding protein [Candidatus Methanodesulfokores washburnensis]